LKLSGDVKRSTYGIALFQDTQNMTYAMRTLLIISFLLFTQLSFAQFQELFNQSIDITTATRIEPNLKGEVSYQEWDGMFILLETKVVIENCNENIFKSFVKEGRYIIDIKNNGSKITLQSHKNLGRVVKSRLGMTKETVYFKIYFPKGLKDQAGNPLTSTIKHEQVDSN